MKNIWARIKQIEQEIQTWFLHVIAVVRQRRELQNDIEVLRLQNAASVEALKSEIAGLRRSVHENLAWLQMSKRDVAGLVGSKPSSI